MVHHFANKSTDYFWGSSRELDSLNGTLTGLDSGISISQVFERLGKHAPSIDDDAKNLIWRALVMRDDILVGDGGKTSFRKLELDDVQSLGLVGNKIKLRTVSTVQSDVQQDAPQGEAGAVNASAPPTPVQTPMGPPVKVPKRKGRPPGKTIDPVLSNPKTTEGPRKRTPKKVFEPANPTPAPKPMKVKAKARSASPAERLITPPVTTTSTSLESPAAILPPNDTLPPTDFLPSNDALPSTNALSSTVEASTPAPTGDGNRIKHLRHAIYTPYEEVQRQEETMRREVGIPGAYLHLFDSQEPSGSGSRAKPGSRIALFKSDKLKNPNWLKEQVGRWKVPYLERIQSASSATEGVRGGQILAAQAPEHRPTKVFQQNPISTQNFSPISEQTFVPTHAGLLNTNEQISTPFQGSPIAVGTTFTPAQVPPQVAPLTTTQPPTGKRKVSIDTGASQLGDQTAEGPSHKKQKLNAEGQPIIRPRKKGRPPSGRPRNNGLFLPNPVMQLMAREYTPPRVSPSQTTYSPQAAQPHPFPQPHLTQNEIARNALPQQNFVISGVQQDVQNQHVQQRFQHPMQHIAQPTGGLGVSQQQVSFPAAGALPANATYQSPYLVNNGAPRTYSSPYSSAPVVQPSPVPTPMQRAPQPVRSITPSPPGPGLSAPLPPPPGTFVNASSTSSAHTLQQSPINNVMLPSGSIVPAPQAISSGVSSITQPSSDTSSTPPHITPVYTPQRQLFPPAASASPPSPTTELPAINAYSSPYALAQPIPAPTPNGVISSHQTLQPTHVENEIQGRKRKSSMTELDALPNKRQNTQTSFIIPPLPSPSAASPSIGPVRPPPPAVSEIDHQKEERELQDGLSAAAAVDIADCTARLSAAYKNSVGNLILSKDQSILTFLVTGETQENPLLELPITQLTNNPIISIEGSRPMELRIKTKDDADVEMTHCFDIGQTKEAQNNANVMRAKLVTARLSASVTPGEKFKLSTISELPGIELLKPWKCPTCPKRWKNREGMVYHQRYARGACNPNFDQNAPKPVRKNAKTPAAEKPPTLKRKRSGKIKPVLGRPATTQTESEAGDAEEAEEAGEDGEIAPNLDDETGNISDDSVDSVIEWAEQASQFKPGMSARRRDAFTRENSEKTILALVEQNGGIFPGDKGLWFAFVRAWNEKYSYTRILPEAKLCADTVELLVAEGKLNITSLSFVDRDFKPASRDLITRPDADLNSPEITQLKQSIEESYPAYYLPPNFAPSDDALRQLEAIYASRDQSATEPPEKDISEPPNKRRKIDYDRTDSVSSYENEDEAEADLDIDVDVDDEDSGLESNGKGSEIENDAPPRRRPRHKASETWKEEQSRRMQARWATVRASGANNLNGALTTPKEVRYTNRRIRVPLSKEEKERRAAMAERKAVTWQSAPTTLQDAGRGTWNQTPEVVKAKRVIVRREQLPEPITFMQAENGAWSVRPYGHGVKPIYARPSRRADGNPHKMVYLNKLDNGFRPVVMPTGDKRKLFPAAPSKHLLNQSIMRSFTPDDEDTDRLGSATRDSFSISPGTEDEPRSRVSKATGKPVRIYKRKKEYQKPSKRRQSVLSIESIVTPKPKPRPQRKTRNSKKAGQNLDPIQKLNFFEPKMGLQNPGLETLPTSFGLGLPQIVDPALLEDLLVHVPATPEIRATIAGQIPKLSGPMLDTIEKIAKWEQRSVLETLSATLAPTYEWVNHTLHSLEYPFNPPTAPIQWRDNASFTLETLPYDELDDSEVFEVLQPQTLPRPKALGGLTRKKRVVIGDFKTRYTCVLSTSFHGIDGDPVEVGKEFGLQVVDVSTVSNRRGRHNALTGYEERRLIMTVIAIRILAGGVDQTIDWVLVATLFPDHTINALTKKWIPIMQKKQDDIERLMVEFQDAFLVAYENGTIKPINYDNLPAYDWGGLVDWGMSVLDVGFAHKSIDLPDTRKQLKKIYKCSEQDPEDSGRREDYYALNGANYKRLDTISAIPNVVPASRSSNNMELDEFTIARSVVRAAAITPQVDWDKDIAINRLKALGDALVEEARDNLIADKVLMHKAKGRATPDRAFEPTDPFSKTLNQKHINHKHILEALNYKRFLDREFANGKAYVRSDYFGKEGPLMCITQLQAHGRIKLVPVNEPKDKWGLTDGNYETTRIPKKKFRFDVHVYPTSTYVYETDSGAVNNAVATEPPRGSEMGEVPVWYGITGVDIPELWKKILSAVGGIVALRAGIDIASLRRIFRPTLEEWELRKLMEWGCKVGFFKRIDEQVEGWTVGEWWWVIAGRACEAAL